MAVKRMSNVELLRILAILIIIFCHDVMASGLSVTDYVGLLPKDGTTDYVLMGNVLLGRIAFLFGPLGASVFFIITGYFLDREKIRWRGIRHIALLFSFYTLVKFFLETYAPWLWKNPIPSEPDGFMNSAAFLGLYFLILCILPWLKGFLSEKGLKVVMLAMCLCAIHVSREQGFWFIADYLAVLLIFPFLCKTFYWLGKTARLCLLGMFAFLLIIVSVGCYDSSVLGALTPIYTFGLHLMFMAPVMVPGMMIPLLTLSSFQCLIGACLRDFDVAAKRRWYSFVLLGGASVFLLLLLLEYDCMGAVQASKHLRLTFFCHPLTLWLAVCFFLCLLWTRMSHVSMINRCASMVLAVYIIHVSPQMSQIWWSGVFTNDQLIGKWYLMLVVFAQSLVVLLGCLVAEAGRQKLFAWLGEKFTPLSNRFRKVDWL